MIRTSKPKVAVMAQEAEANGFFFPSGRATAGQLRNLHALYMRCLRDSWIHAHGDLPKETIGEFFKLGKSQASKLARDVREMGGTPTGRFVVELLHGMLAGDVAGVAGTPRNQENRQAFRLVDRFDARTYHSDLPRSFSTIPIVKIPGCEGDDGSGITRVVYDGSGDARIVNIQRRDEDGTLWCEDWRDPSDRDVFRMLHGRFKCDYQQWIGGFECG